MRRRSIRGRRRSAFQIGSMRSQPSSGISQAFAWVSRSRGQVTYVLLTRSPLGGLLRPVRLACIRHAASVHPEPGSNSPLNYSQPFGCFILLFAVLSPELSGLLYFCCFSIVKVLALPSSSGNRDNYMHSLLFVKGFSKIRDFA